jgi:hypothetical protein
MHFVRGSSLALCVTRRSDISEPLLLGNFSGLRLVDLRLHLDPAESTESYLELIAEGHGRHRHLRFSSPRNLSIDEGFQGSIGGMLVYDISERQWYGARIWAKNAEQDPGISFLAARMEIVSDT